MSSSILGLPPIPADLKPITPYLQRAEELKNQDPVVSYWCAYYAAQVGITLKARSTPARDVLFALLNSLEHMKTAIGKNDAIEIESVSSAYMENFALKVFANADNEDRSGRSTRATAKKFLAAANFLEVLKTFPKSDVSESNEDKIRYAKWKAADIAKAFREGHKPAPGPPGWAEEQEELKALQQEQEQQEQHLISSRPKTYPHLPSTQSHSPPLNSPPRSSHIPSSSPPKNSPPKADLHFAIGKPDLGWPTGSDGPPESWSTAATPGTESSDIYTIGTPTPSTAGYDRDPSSHAGAGVTISHKRDGSGSSSNTLSSNGNKGPRGWTNEELAGKLTPTSSPTKSSFKSGSPDSDKKVHFSPSTAGSPPPPPPPQLKPGSGSPTQYLGPASIYGPPEPPVSPPRGTQSGYPSIPMYPSSQPPPSAPHSTSPPQPYIYAPPPPPPPSAPSPHHSAIQAAGRNTYTNPPPPPAQAVELTPGLIAKAQKCCRFAISSLDYEDIEQAKKELRAALDLLGG